MSKPVSNPARAGERANTARRTVLKGFAGAAAIGLVLLPTPLGRWLF